MRQIFVVLIIFGLSFNSIRSEDKFSLVGSRTIQHGSQYDVFIDSSDFSHDTEVVLRLKGKEEKYFKVKAPASKEDGSRTLNFNLPEKALAENYTLSILSHQNGMCAFSEIPIFPIRKEYSIFIQLDKPLYKPRESAKFRIVLLDQNTKPFKPEKLHVAITEAKGDIIREFQVNTNDAMKMGIYENIFDIAEEPNFGLWNISVMVNGRKDENVTKTFEVKEYVLPLVNVHIESGSYLLHTDSLLRLFISAKYSFGMLAKGNAEVNIKVYDKDKIQKHSITKKLSIETRKAIDFDIKKDLKISPSDTDRIIQINVDFIDELTGQKYYKTKEISIRNKNSFHIRIYKQKTFVPANNYEFYVSIKDFDGIPQSSQSYPITMKCEYNNDKERETIQPTFLKNGFARFSWFVPKGITGLKITITYRDTTKTFEVAPGQDTKNENFEATVTNEKTTLKDAITLQLKAVNNIDVVNYVVIGRLGVAEGGRFDCQLKDFCEFLIKPNEQMLPEATVLVYFVNRNDDLLFDTTKVRFDEISSNFLDIKVSKKTVAPGSNVKLNIASSPNSFVALLGIDESITYLRTGNDIDNIDVSKDLLRYGHTDFLINQPNAKIIENSFVFQGNFKNLHVCTNEEKKMLLKDENSVGLDSRFEEEEDADYGFNPDDEEDDEEDADEPQVRRDFREIFIYESFDVGHSGKSTKQFKLPDTITTWLITGFAMNQQNGFALAEPTQITTTQQMFVKLHLPYSIKFGEILKVDATVFNFIAARNALKVDVTMFTGDDEQQYFEFIEFENCQPRSVAEEEITKPVSVTQNSAKTVSFHIRALKSGKIKILVKAKSSKVKDAIERTLNVEHEGTTYFDTENVVIDLNTTNEFFKQIEFKIPIETIVPNSLQIYGTVSSVLIPVPPLQRSKAGQNFVKNAVPHPNDCNEQRTTKFSVNVIAYTFLRARKLLTSTLTSNAIDYLSTGYQAILKYRKTSDGSFSLWSNVADNIWMTAYIAKLFGQARNAITINDQYLRQALNYLVAKQGASGGYEKYNSISSVYYQSRLKPQGITMTAFVLIAFLENAHLKSEYNNLIIKGFQYISENVDNTNSNYAIAISAYAFALADRKEDAARLIETLNSNAITQGDKKFWNDQGKTCNAKSTCIEITSYALLTLAKLEKLNEAIPLENYLISQKNANGGYDSTFCTVLAINALAEIGKLTKNDLFSAHVQIKTDLDEIKNFAIESKKYIANPIVSMKPETKKVMISANKTEGSGTCHASIEFKYIKREANVTRNFDLNVEIVSSDDRQATLKVCAKFVPDGVVDTATMTLLEIQTPSGYIIDKQNNLGTQNLLKYQKMELKSLDTIANIYFDSFTTAEVCPTLKLIKMNKVAELKKSTVKIYDFYNMKFRATTFYSINQSDNCGT